VAVIARSARLAWFAALAAFAVSLVPCFAAAESRVRDLTVHPGDVPRRLVGYGLVVGLDGTGDRSFGATTSNTPTVRSVINLLRRFDVEVPTQQLRLRNVAAVLVTAEMSPYLRAGGRFDVQVAAMGDATSLRGGVLWMTPLVSAPDDPPVATAQGPLTVSVDEASRTRSVRLVNSGVIPDGGLMEADPAAALAAEPRLLVRQPDLATASRIAEAVNAAFGPGTAKVDDPGAVSLTPGAKASEGLLGFLAAVDTVRLDAGAPARIVISSRDGTVAAGGAVRVGPAVVSHRGITLQIGGAAAPAVADSTALDPHLVRMSGDAALSDVAAALHAAGAGPEEMAAIFDALRAAGALRAEVVVR
jgi:flagellar P-ring protein precursor FlgI